MLATEHPNTVRVTLLNGEVHTIPGPAIRNDSIVYASGAVPLADVTSMEVRRFSLARTVILTGAMLGLSAGWTEAVGSTRAGSVSSPTPLPK